MLRFLAENRGLLLLFLFWFLVGSASTPLFFLVGVLSLLLLWRRGLYFEMLLGFFFILILSDNLRYNTDFAKVFKNLYILILTATAILDRKHMHTGNNLLKYFIPFLVVATVGLFFSPNIFLGFQKQLSYALLLFVVPVFMVNVFKERGPIVIKDLIYFGVFIVIIGYLMRYIDPGLAYSHGGRFRGIFGNPNGLGVFCSLLFALAVVAREYFPVLFSKTDLRWIFVPILLALVLSGSRSALIGVILFYILSKFYKVHPGFGFLVFLALVFATELIFSNLVSIVQSFGLAEYLRVETIQDGSGRYVAWNFAWENIQNHFWFGRGFSFDEWLMNSVKDILNDLGHQGGVHNTYLIIWLNTGIIGLFLFIRGYFLLFLKAAQNTRFSFPVFYLVLFGITLEPWLAASLNPFTIILIMLITVMTESVFQSYISDEMKSTQVHHDEAPLLV